MDDLKPIGRVRKGNRGLVRSALMIGGTLCGYVVIGEAILDWAMSDGGFSPHRVPIVRVFGAAVGFMMGLALGTIVQSKRRWMNSDVKH